MNPAFTTASEPQFVPSDTPLPPVKFLDESGALLDGAAPLLDEAQVLEALRLMMLGRAFDTKCWSLQRQGKLGTFAPINGQEATIVGAAMALDPSRDWMVPQYRELPGLMRHGFPPELVVLYRQGHPDGGIVPDGVKVLQYQVSLAAQLPHAVGLAWGMQLQETARRVVGLLRRRRLVGGRLSRVVQPRRRAGGAGGVRAAETTSGRSPHRGRPRAPSPTSRRARARLRLPRACRSTATICWRCTG